LVDEVHFATSKRGRARGNISDLLLKYFR
jgi:hypothetical protein